MRKITHIVVHHTASVSNPTIHQLMAVDRYHRDKDWGGGARARKSRLGYYVQYHYFIEADGTLTKTADHDEIRWHAGNANTFTIGVCMAGQFELGVQMPTEAQKKALSGLLQGLKVELGIEAQKIVPHRHFMPKTCYGLALSDDWASKLSTIKKTSMIAFNYKGTIYVAVFAKFVPIADQETFIELGGSWDYVKELNVDEFNSIIRPFLAQSTILK